MFSKTKLLQVITASSLFALGLTACVKKRADLVNPSEVYDESITFKAPSVNPLWTKNSDFDSYLKKTDYKIRTGNVLLKPQNSIAEELISEPDANLKFLDVMNFESDHPYLQGKAELAYMLGEPNKTYGVTEELTPTHLILYKVVSNDELGFNEKTFARRDGSNWLVPVGGYEVTYYMKEKARNDDNRATNMWVYNPVPAVDFKKANSYRVDQTKFIPFDRFVKADVLPKSFFDGEWYFTETTVDVRYDNGSSIGTLGGSDSNFLPATRIRFKIYDDQIVAQNTNVDDDFKDDPNSLNYNTVLKIGIDHRDFKWVRSGKDALKEIEESTKEKAEKRYIQLKYLESDTPQLSFESILGSLFGRINNFRNVLDVTYGKDYFSYSIRDAQNGTIIRYSMRKIPDYKRARNGQCLDASQLGCMSPRQAFKDDNFIYGTFVTQKYKKIDYKVPLKEDMEKLLIMARHNPKKEIVYHFTDRTPKEKWYRDIGREAINMWAQAFEKANVKTKIRLDESKDVPLGDIRYNVLNIVKRAGAGLLGFGPSLIDSETGEIVSASMNTGVDNILEQYYRVVRNYLGRKSGRYYNFKQDNQSTALPAVLNLIAQVNTFQYEVDNKTGQILLNGSTNLNPSLFTDTEKEFLRSVNLAADAPVADFVKTVNELRLHSYRYALSSPFDIGLFNAGEAEFSSTMVLDKTIDRNCKEVTALAERMKTEIVHTPEEISIIEPCVKMLAQGEAVLTTVHELGHNLSLRHNFRGSVDTANYPDVNSYTAKYIKLADGVQKPMTSSIMEYVTQEGQQIMPGQYDLAAIRWIYNEEVQTKDGSIVKIDTTKKIADNLSVDQLKPFQYCTDEQRILITDPLCNYFDQGTTVKETVRFQIEQVYNSLSSAYRYDKRSAGYPAAVLSVQGASLKAKYDKWRGFLRKLTGTNKSYLQGFTAQSYSDFISSKKETLKGTELAELNEHLEVRNMIVQFLVDLAFISNKYCVVKDASGVQKLIELEKIRKELFGAGIYSVVSSCQSPDASKYIADNNLTFIEEFGHFLDEGQYDQNPNKRLEPLDYTGTGSIRGLAMFLLNTRISPSINNQLEGFYPNMMDEPDIRQYIQALILDRMANGVRRAHDNSKSEYAVQKTDLFNASDYKKVIANPAFVNFNNESNLIQSFAAIMTNSLAIPGAPDDGRMQYVTVNSAPREQLDGVKNVAADYMMFANKILFVEDTKSFAAKIMKRYKGVNQMKGLATNLTVENLIQVKESVLQTITPMLFQPPNVVTLADLVKLLEFVDQSVSQLQGQQQDSKTAAIFYALITIFEPERTLANSLEGQLGISFSDLTKIANTQNDPHQKDAQKVLEQPLGPIYTQLQQQFPGVQLPSVVEMQARYDKMVSNQATLVKNYSLNADEYDSQIDLLQRILQILSALTN